MAESNLFPNTDGTQITGITVTKSEGGGTPSNIVDGDIGTTDSIVSINQYWQLDLGSSKNICKYRIYPTSTAAWTVKASLTGSFADGDYYYIDQLSTGGASSTSRGITLNAWNTFYINPKITTRYIRITMASSSGESIAEFEVYEDTEAPFGSLSSDDTDYDGSISSIEEFRRRSLIDNLIATSPPGLGIDNGKYFQIDLGSLINVSKVGTYISSNGKYSVKVSTTGAFGGEEITVVSSAVTRVAGQYNDTTNLPYVCRYIRYGAVTTVPLLTEITVYKLSPEVTITSDTNIRSTVEQDILSDAVILSVISNDIYSDTLVVETYEEDILSDTSIFAPVIKTILSDAKIFSTLTELIYSDTLIKLIVSTDILSDADVLVTESFDILSDSKIVWQWSSDLGSDAIVFVPVDLRCEAKLTKSSLRDLNVETRVIQPTPTIPTGLTAVNTGTGDSIRLEWSGTSPFYNVYRVDPGPTYVKVNNFLISDSFYVVGGLTEGVTYTFVVRGANGQG